MYYVLVFIILLMYNRLGDYSLAIRYKKDTIYAYWICAILVFMAAFRGDMVGADTLGYRLDYESMTSYKTLESIIDRYTISYIGYFGLSKLFSLAHMPVQVWFGFVEAFYLLALMKLVNRFSKDKVFSLLLFTTIGLFTFSLAGLKQTMGSAMIMLAFIYFLEHRYLVFIILVIATYYTHPAALIGIGVLPFYFFRNKKWLIPLTIVICLCVYVYSMVFISTMFNLLGNDHFETYLVNDSSYTYTTFIFYVTITVIAFVNFKFYNKGDSEYAKLFLSLSFVGCGLQLLAGVSPSLFRLALMYTPFMTVLIPNCIYYNKSSYNNLIKICLFICVVFYFIYTNRFFPYEFC